MKLFLLSCIIGASLFMTSCSSDENIQGAGDKGSISLNLIADAGFGTSTRAVQESGYTNVNNYTVQILNSANEVKKEVVYSEFPAKVELENGSYTLKAFYGKESDASRTAFYVEGTTSFSINGKDVEGLTVNCAPTCGKVKVNFDSKMAEYFTDYYVVYETGALTAAGKTATWAKDDTEPWYLKLNKDGEEVKATIHAIRKSDNKDGAVTKTYTLQRNKAWTLGISPINANGQLGLEITIDESTNDHEIDITVPSEWL